MKKLWLAAAFTSLLTTGCVEQQLQIDTSSVIPTLASIQREQVLENLRRYLDDCDAVPVQVTISGGSVQVAGQFQPSFGFPFHGWMGNQATLQLQRQVTENWSLQPVTDANDLRRLRALYRRAVGAITDSSEFRLEYPEVAAKDKNGNPSTNAVSINKYFDPIEKWTITTRFVSTNYSCQTSHRYLLSTGKFIYYSSDEDLDAFSMYVLGATPDTTGSTGGAAGIGGKPGQVLINAIQ